MRKRVTVMDVAGVVWVGFVNLILNRSAMGSLFFSFNIVE